MMLAFYSKNFEGWSSQQRLCAVLFGLVHLHIQGLRDYMIQKNSSVNINFLASVDGFNFELHTYKASVLTSAPVGQSLNDSELMAKAVW